MATTDPIEAVKHIPMRDRVNEAAEPETEACHPEGYKCLGDPLAEALGDSMVATDGNYSWRDLDPGYHRDLLYRANRVRKSLANRGLALVAERATAAVDRYGGLIATMDNAVAQGLTVHVATRATCAGHLEHGDDKATKPLTAAAFATAAVDVERLAAAIQSVRDYDDDYEAAEEAAEMASEYARLSGESE